MMFFVFILLCVSICKDLNSQSYPITNYNPFQIKTSNTFTSTSILNSKNNISGFDYRFPIDNKNLTEINKIKKMFEKKILLDILTDQNVPIITKMYLLKNNNINPSNILAGGLLKNFDFIDF